MVRTLILSLALTLSACAHTPSIIDGGIYGGGWILVEWRGMLVELRTEMMCASKRDCAVVACVTVAGEEPVCREVGQ